MVYYGAVAGARTLSTLYLFYMLLQLGGSSLVAASFCDWAEGAGVRVVMRVQCGVNEVKLVRDVEIQVGERIVFRLEMFGRIFAI